MSPLQSDPLPQMCAAHTAKLDILLAQQVEHGKKLDQIINHIWIGNGTPSLTTRVNAIEQHLETEPKEVDTRLVKIEQVIQALCWIVGVTVAGCIALGLDRMFHRG